MRLLAGTYTPVTLWETGRPHDLSDELPLFMPVECALSLLPNKEVQLCWDYVPARYLLAYQPFEKPSLIAERPSDTETEITWRLIEEVAVAGAVAAGRTRSNAGKSTSVGKAVSRAELAQQLALGRTVQSARSMPQKTRR